MVRTDLNQIPAYSPGRSLPQAIKLASNEVSQPPLPAVVAALEQALPQLNRYPDMAAGQLRTQLARTLSPRYAAAAGRDLTVDNVAVGNGSSALCLAAILATCTHGDEVLFAWRSFEAYPILTRVAGAEPVMVPLRNHRHDLPAMLAAITDRTRLIFICNPNNPTGTTISHADFCAFMDQVPDNVQVVLDEAYVEYDTSRSVDGLGALATYPNLAVCRTFSKAYGLAGLRIGYMAGHPEFITALRKVAVPFEVSLLAQVGALASLSVDATAELHSRISHTVEQRERVLGVVPPELRVPSETNFVWLPVGEAAVDVGQRLEDAGIVVRVFPREGVRITITEESEVDVLVQALPDTLAL